MTVYDPTYLKVPEASGVVKGPLVEIAFLAAAEDIHDSLGISGVLAKLDSLRAIADELVLLDVIEGYSLGGRGSLFADKPTIATINAKGSVGEDWTTLCDRVERHLVDYRCDVTPEEPWMEYSFYHDPRYGDDFEPHY
ncbi:MAG: hypothetical protein AB8B83_00960 [Bdellovibrionales bacterium]